MREASDGIWTFFAKNLLYKMWKTIPQPSPKAKVKNWKKKQIQILNLIIEKTNKWKIEINKITKK